ncbi:MAG: hypothetical protein R3Y28_00350 [Candidatus Gastranaerophilales bacterium]
MNDFIKFLKEIFLMKENDGYKVGLSQFKPAEKKIEKVFKMKKSKDIKISDLMRRA